MSKLTDEAIWVLETKSGIYMREADTYLNFVRKLGFLGDIGVLRREHTYSKSGALINLRFVVIIDNTDERKISKGIVTRHAKPYSTRFHKKATGLWERYYV